MSATPHTIDVTRLRASFAVIGQDADGFVKALYRELFRRAPWLRGLFPEEMAAQEKKLLDVLAFAVGALDRTEQLVPQLEAMGRRHVDYGVVTADYAVLGETLLTVLPDHVGGMWDDALAADWGAAFQALTAPMIAAAEEKTRGRN